jgi:hypothetical protein
MRTQQFMFRKGEVLKPPTFDFEPQLILVFGARSILEHQSLFTQIRESHPGVAFAGCSTSGEITNNSVTDDSLSLTAVYFQKTSVHSFCQSVQDSSESFETGKTLGNELSKDKLKHVMVFSDGLNVNGTELVNGLRDALGDDVSITGGLAGDGAAFEKTVVLNPCGKVESHIVSAIGFYSDDLKVSFGSMGGWDTFGIERLVTKSKGNVLYELDNEPALDLYKTYLGDQASGLPATGLLFPLSMRVSETDEPVVRTILGVNEEDKSLTFAGDIKEDSYVRLMKANVNRLIDGADKAAKLTAKPDVNYDLAILISCVGRKLVLKQLAEEEVEVVGDSFGADTLITGFYSYGEIAPFEEFMKCELHNQTMTITAFSE